VPLDRRFTARLLGFDGVWPNALDATSARDHVLELLSALAILQCTLSRLAADLIFLCGEETGIFEYPDELADTSSAMPQKKNPDPLELVRGRAGTLAGALSGALAITHGLPSGYSRDLQELKPALWRGIATARDSAVIMRLAAERMRVRAGRAAGILERGFAAALDLAEDLCLRRNVPFRRAHFAVGQLVRILAANGRTLSQADAAEASRILSRGAARPIEFSPAEWSSAVDPGIGASRRRTAGGPGDTAALRRRAETVNRRIERTIRSLRARELRAASFLRAEVGRRIRARRG
jgi:argininosuccinate lyase